MYLSHWSLTRPPFAVVPDSRFLFPTESHENALAAIRYAACESGEPVLLCGMPGSGKTLLLRALRRQLPMARFCVAFVPETRVADVGLLPRVAFHLTHRIVSDVVAAMEAILKKADEATRKGQSVVVMLDDWPVDAPNEMLDSLRWLLNLDAESTGLCVQMASEPLDPSENWPNWLAQRVLTVARLSPSLATEQVAEYLAHRLRAAGHADGNLFLPEAATRINNWSNGIPRLINRLAHLALEVAYLSLARHVDEPTVQKAIERLNHFGSMKRPAASTPKVPPAASDPVPAPIIARGIPTGPPS